MADRIAKCHFCISLRMIIGKHESHVCQKRNKLPYVKLGGNAQTGATLCKDDSPILHLIDSVFLYPQSCSKSQQNSAIKDILNLNRLETIKCWVFGIFSLRPNLNRKKLPRHVLLGQTNTGHNKCLSKKIKALPFAF